MNASDKIMYENKKKRNYGNKNVYINIPLKDRLDIESIPC